MLVTHLTDDATGLSQEDRSEPQEEMFCKMH
jgi:hypothetical protein